jgi:hypothetical protein
MGLFLSMSAISRVGSGAVESCVHSYAEQHKGRCEPATPEARLSDLLILDESDQQNVTAQYPGAFLQWEEATAFLSRSLRTPAFAFHIHDDDLWMYGLYVEGKLVDQFNPLPAYWDDSIRFPRRKGADGQGMRRWCRVSGLALKSASSAPTSSSGTWTAKLQARRSRTTSLGSMTAGR